MLTAETKRHIDAARQVLVGVVPNPAAQIDQITNALIYKFMDDMDQSAIRAGDKPSFFVGELERYAWTRVMDSRLGNQERMNLYAEALVKFSTSQKLPELFRDIFRQAYLPFRSPDVLYLFLKEIDYFGYSHSEELGNAYEYLLSILSAQGDAGQFRTPRHIIDFIVDVVDPTPDDTVLDPACGTAGFLISAYKHILEKHTEIDKKTGKAKSTLTPIQRQKIMKNFEGYDISPEMVKLSRVNMYLHHFKNPKIYEYDTLSREERWNDKFSVILANPPFMSPKGGIKPHSRFSIESSRSEVLFVDYFIEHLKQPNGRAGMIVPEGIIFQSGGSHRQIRENLIKDGLYAVVSLPAGVFNPYSGVKTSILFFDNAIVKKTKKILFVRIENDGYSLGAQRRPIDKNDLTDALNVLQAWRGHVLNGSPSLESPIAFAIEREAITKTDDLNLSAERYRTGFDYTDAKWPMVPLEEICSLESGSRQKGGAVARGVYSIGGEQISEDNTIRFGKMKYITEAHFSEMRKGILAKGDVLMVKDGATTGKIGFWDYDYRAAVNEHVFILRSKDNVLPKYLYNVLLSESFQNELRPYIKGIIGGISLEIKKIKIPLPPIEVQREVVKELDGYQRIIESAHAIIENWKPSLKLDSGWESKRLEDITERITKGTTPTTIGFNYVDSGINFVKVESIDAMGDFLPGKIAHISNECHEALKRSQLRSGDVLFSIAGALGRVALVTKEILPANTNQALAIITPAGELDSEYLEQVLRSDLISSRLDSLKVGVAQSNISLAQVSDFRIPLPNISIQKEIVAQIKSERVLIDANKRLVEIYKEKTREAMAKLWMK